MLCVFPSYPCEHAVRGVHDYISCRGHRNQSENSHEHLWGLREEIATRQVLRVYVYDLFLSRQHASCHSCPFSLGTCCGHAVLVCWKAFNTLLLGFDSSICCETGKHPSHHAQHVEGHSTLRNKFRTCTMIRNQATIQATMHSRWKDTYPTKHDLHQGSW